MYRKIIFVFLIGIWHFYSIAQTVKIGNQVWNTKNLDVSSFRNGDIIPVAESYAVWEDAYKNHQPAWCYYDFNVSYKENHGKLYNIWALLDPRGLTPAGWRIPSIDDWRTLIKYLGGSEIAGKKLKSTKGWNSYKDGGKSSKICPKCENWSDEYRKKVPCHTCKDTRWVDVFEPIVTHSGNGTNISGFSALPGGTIDRDNFGAFTCNSYGKDVVYWSTSISQIDQYINHGVITLHYTIDDATDFEEKHWTRSVFPIGGHYIRCLK